MGWFVILSLLVDVYASIPPISSLLLSLYYLLGSSDLEQELEAILILQKEDINYCYPISELALLM